MQSKGYFQPEQAREVAAMFVKHGIDYLFIGKSAAILLGFPSVTQDIDVFPNNEKQNCERLIAALLELGFELSEKTRLDILSGVDFVQINQDPFDIDLVFAPDGIENFEVARKRMTLIENFPIANIRDIIASKKASGRKKDLYDLPMLEDFRIEFEKSQRGEPKTAVEIALEKLEKRHK